LLIKLFSSKLVQNKGVLMKKLILVSMILGCVSFSQANETKEGKEMAK